MHGFFHRFFSNRLTGVSREAVVYFRGRRWEWKGTGYFWRK